jgi:hypothetical protein
MARRQPLSTTEISLRAKLAAHSKWARTEDPSAATAPARAAFEGRWEREADPDGVLDPVERARRAHHLRQAYFMRLSLLAAQARQRRAS